MAASPLRRLLDAFFVRLARLVVRTFYREVEVVGAERLPRGVPVVLAANHPNGLVDALVVLACLGLRPRVLARSTLFDNPTLRPLITLAGVLPVYRREDAAAEMAKNAGVFVRCHEELARGGAILIFPEGRSHHEAALLPLRSGAARIALEAEACLGPLGTRIVPVGLGYDARDRFRSRVRLEVGAPIDPALEIAAHAARPHDAVRALTARLERRLRAVGGRVPARPERERPAERTLRVAAGALNAVPCLLAVRIALHATERVEMRATWKILAGLYLLPVCWVAQAAVVGWWAGLPAGVALGLAAPATGWLATRPRSNEAACPRTLPRAA